MGGKNYYQQETKKINIVANYSVLAKIYPHLMRSIDYKKWTQYILEIRKEIKKKNITALELASGTGEISKIVFSKMKLFIPIDISFSMLQNSNYDGISAVCCNMIYLPFKNIFDFIFSTFDSMNYLQKKEDYFQLLNSVSNCISSNGIFTFDVGLENNSIKHEKHLNRTGKTEGISYSQKSFYDRNSRIHYNQFQIRLADGTRVEEIHKQKIFRFEDYFDIIDKTDFYVSACYNTFSFDNANEKSGRIQFILKKKNYA